MWARLKFNSPHACLRRAQSAARQEATSRMAKYLTRDTILLRRTIHGPLLRSLFEKMFNVLQGIRLKSFRGLRPCI